MTFCACAVEKKQIEKMAVNKNLKMGFMINSWIYYELGTKKKNNRQDNQIRRLTT